MADLTITTQDELPGPGDDGPYVMFVNQTENGIGRSLAHQRALGTAGSQALLLDPLPPERAAASERQRRGDRAGPAGGD